MGELLHAGLWGFLSSVFITFFRAVRVVLDFFKCALPPPLYPDDDSQLCARVTMYICLFSQELVPLHVGASEGTTFGS